MRKISAAIVAATIAAAMFAGSAHADPSTSPEDGRNASLPGFSDAAVRVNHAYELLSPVLEKFPEAVGVVKVDNDSETIQVPYDPASKQSEFLRSEIESLSFGNVAVQLVEAEFTFRDAESAATELATGKAEELFGVKPLLVTFDSNGVNIILPDTVAGDVAARSLTIGDDLGVQVQVSKGAVEDYDIKLSAGTAAADVSPYSGGAHLMTANSPSGQSHCTSGFVFDKWTTRERLVSTAFHCNFAAAGAPETFFTASSSGRQLVGTMWYHAPAGHQAADVMLLRAAPGASFNNPTAYVGPSDKRTVGAYVQSVGQGQVAAKYGGTTGYTSFTIGGHAVLQYGDGSSRTFAWANTNCQGGDSGGPMFWARSDMKITAAGQTTAASSTTCYFLQVGMMSQTIAGTVLTG